MYTYTLQNSGTTTRSAPYNVSDDKVSNVNCAGATLKPGQSTPCIGTYTIPGRPGRGLGDEPCPATLSNNSVAPGASPLLDFHFAKKYFASGAERILVQFQEPACPLLDSDNDSQLP